MGCDVCGFDAADWDEQDLVRTLRLAGEFVAGVAVGLPVQRPAGVDPSLRPLPKVTGRGLDADVAEAHRLFHHVRVVADQRAGVGDLPPMQHGTIVQLSASGGGVPKRAVPDGLVRVGRRGFDVDVQRSRVHHGRVWQALCLWSAEVIEGLQAEGHPIDFGNAGENVTIRGFDWTLLRTGLELQLGEVRCRVTAPTEPCSKNKGWFADGDPSRMDHRRHPGWSRWYAEVVVGGVLRVGDPAVLAPR